ncbi:MAG: prepilin-type N-terminal cleavage/methylation domain-containing protein [Planctomycetota bacterium]
MKHHRRQSGMTLIEVTIALVVATATVFLLTSTIGSTVNVSASKYERARAVDAARNLFELMRSLPASELFARYNHEPSDDPGGAGTAPGAHFAIEDLSPLDTDLDGFPGEVLLPAKFAPLREDVQNTALGFPRDINGDSVVDDKDHASDYIILPVCIRVEWKGKSGKQSMVMYCIFSSLKKKA